jgi:hypothetical protein
MQIDRCASSSQHTVHLQCMYVETQDHIKEANTVIHEYSQIIVIVALLPVSNSVFFFFLHQKRNFHEGLLSLKLAFLFTILNTLRI